MSTEQRNRTKTPTVSAFRLSGHSSLLLWASARKHPFPLNMHWLPLVAVVGMLAHQTLGVLHWLLDPMGSFVPNLVDLWQVVSLHLEVELCLEVAYTTLNWAVLLEVEHELDEQLELVALVVEWIEWIDLEDVQLVQLPHWQRELLRIWFFRWTSLHGVAQPPHHHSKNRPLLSPKEDASLSRYLEEHQWMMSCWEVTCHDLP